MWVIAEYMSTNVPGQNIDYTKKCPVISYHFPVVVINP